MQDEVTTDSNNIFCDRYELDSYIAIMCMHVGV